MTLRLLALVLAFGGSSAWAQSQPPATPSPAPSAAPSQSAPSTPAQTSPSDALPDAPSTTTQARPPVVPTGPTAVIDTTMGRLACTLYDKQAPVTVANFIGLAEGLKDWTDPKTLKKVHGEPFYNGTTFHRVIPSFMIQGGDKLGDGRGDPGYLFQDEFDPTLTFDEPGRLAMANSGPNTNGSQFFITEVSVPQLNGKHTIFGQCDSHTVLLVASMARVQRDESDKPITPIVINKITIVRNGQPMPPEPQISAPAATSPTQ